MVEDSAFRAGRRHTLSSPRLLLFVYLTNATLLLCHEIDSAFWREWELFHLPGGAAGFVGLHMVLVPLVLWGVVAIARHRPSGRWLALLVGLSGLAGGVVHTVFLLAGDTRFATPFSTGLIAAFTVTSAAQVLLVVPLGRSRAAAESG